MAEKDPPKPRPGLELPDDTETGTIYDPEIGKLITGEVIPGSPGQKDTFIVEEEETWPPKSDKDKKSGSH